jgi:hypothetical protein
MKDQTSISREQASTLLSELKSLYGAMPSEMRQAIKQLIGSIYSPEDTGHQMGQSA